MEVRRHWDLAYDVDDVLRSQAADPEVIRGRRPGLVDLAQRALDEAGDLVEPAVLSRPLRVESVRHRRVILEGGAALTGRLVVEHLGAAERVVVMLCTVGGAVSDLALRTGGSNLGLGLAIDAVGSAAVQALSAAACNHVEREALAAGLRTSLPLSPGLEGWPVDPGQREVFAVIDPELVGVVLSPDLQMRPLKSTTSVVGVGAEVASSGSVCEHCSLRDTCRHRF